MKNSILISIISLLLLSCSKKAFLFTSFHEPATEGLRMLYSFDGYKWKGIDRVLLTPKVGLQKVLRDPSMVQGPDGTFHLVWTSSWRGDLGFGYAYSKDLIHWSDQRLIPVMEDEPGTVNVWAPELYYDADSKLFLIIWASCIPGRFSRGLEADSNNHRMYITTTPDFKVFSKTRLFLDPKFSVIDAAIVRRKAKDFVLVLKDNTRPERNIRVAFSDSPFGPWENMSKPFTDNFTEGPSVVKLNDQWLIYYDAYSSKTYEASATKDFIDFTKLNQQVKLPEAHKHGTIVTVKRHFVKQLIRNCNSQ